ncbi:uncharacterized protein EV420DRAFT_1766426 [Desarmillaria tabescens]|uniref:Protein kinase domain-containing protein n=1 Tax=Armillaria tabescens TaxID=1929756 RepID=A0AA39MYI7_ARMTA|nr:uncharacterized protein EV420DRAFT_1766426 [Desarmillaria tabescens]KAK0451397.1 hypothetical protein EV420DRAFT_1766426 [Desarmillaria tabescens]
MNSFTLPKRRLKMQCHSRRYHRDARNRDASGASELSSVNEEPSMPIGYHRFTFPQSCILDRIIEERCIRSFEKVDRKNPANFHRGLKMTLQKADTTNIVITLGDVIHYQRGLVGRNTCVVTAEGPEWPGKQLVVKISWPSIYRDSEKKFIDAAKAKAREMTSKGKEHWVLDHLPEIFHSEEFQFDDEDSPQGRLRKLLIDAAYVDGNTFIYDERFPRITVSERLCSLDTLNDVKEIGQVFLDILQCHRWLFDHPKILHRDISMTNVMYRRRHGQVCGVLNDFDLSSFLPLRDASSLHRTGTAPYMACDLLRATDISHLYRHDIEALFYVLMMLCCHYEIVRSDKGSTMKELKTEKGKKPPFSDWFDRMMTWEALSRQKRCFLAEDTPIPTSTSFSAFLPWLQDIRVAFGDGFHARTKSKIQPNPKRKIPANFIPPSERDLTNRPSSIQVPVPFDDETLGGYVVYSDFLATMSDIGGHSLVIKNVQ